jgi:hypothetical protein
MGNLLRKTNSNFRFQISNDLNFKLKTYFNRDEGDKGDKC